MTTRAAIYARQSISNAEGVESQAARCRAMVEERGWTVATIYTENNVSASRARPQGWATLLKDGQAGQFTHVVGVDMDRLLRSITDLADLFKAQLRVVTVDGEIDTSTADGEYRATQLTAGARFEVRRKAERMVRANTRRREGGLPTAGMPPYGWTWVRKHDRGADGMPWLAVPEAQAVVQECYQRFLTGETLGAICSDLTKRGVLTTKGVAWESPTLRRTLLNPAYAALIPKPRTDGKHYNVAEVTPEDCTPGVWEPIVDQGTWLAARTMLLDPARTSNGGMVARKWLLSGLAVCAVCNAPVRASVTRERHRGYRCRSEAHFQRRAQGIDDLVRASVLGFLAKPEVRAALTTPTSDGRNVKAELDAERVKETELGAAYAAGLVTLATLTAATEGLRSRVADLEDELMLRAASNPVLALVGADDIVARWDSMPLEGRRAVVRALTESVTIHPTGKGRSAVTMENVVVRWRGEASA